MRNEFRRHQKSDRIKWILAFAAILLLAAGLTLLSLQLFSPYKPSNGFKKEKSPAPSTAVASNVRLTEKAANEYVITIEGMPYTLYNVQKTADATDAAASLTFEAHDSGYAFKLVAVGTPTGGEYWDTGRLILSQKGGQIYAKYPMPGYVSTTPQYIDVGQLIQTLNAENISFDLSAPFELYVCQSSTEGGGEPNFGIQTATYTFSIREGNEPEDPATYTWYLYDIQTTGDYPATPPSDTTGWPGIIGVALDWDGTLHTGEAYDTSKQYRLVLRANGNTCLASSDEVWYSDSTTVAILEHISGLTDAEKDLANFQVYWTSDTQDTAASNVISFKMKKVKNLSLPETPTKEGYTFTGWYLDEACTQPYEGTPVTETTTFYAGWKINRYTVILVSGNHTALEPLTVDWNTVPTLPELTRTGYDFIGWYNGDTLYENAPIKGDVTLTARWTIKRLTVTFMNGDTVYKQITVDWGTTLKAIEATENVRVQSVALSNGQMPTYENGEMLLTADAVMDVTIAAEKPAETNNKLYLYIGIGVGAFGLLCLFLALLRRR